MGTPETRAKWPGLVANLVIVLGLLGLGSAQVATEKTATSFVARGAFWHAANERGDLLRVSANTEGILIGAGDRLELGQERTGDRVIDQVRVLASRQDEASPIDIRSRESDRGALITRLAPAYSYGLVFLREQAGQPVLKLEQRVDKDLAGALFQPVELTLRLAGTTLEAQVNRDESLRTQAVDDSGGALAVTTTIGNLRVLRIEISGRDGDQPFVESDDFKHLPRPSIMAAAARGVGRGLIALGLLCIALLGCCGARPDANALRSALTRAAMLPALACAAALARGELARVPPTGLLLLLAAPSFGAALFRLRPFLDRATPGTPRVPAWLAPLFFIGVAALAVHTGFEHRSAQLEPLREERRKAAGPDAAPFVQAHAVRLTAATSLPVHASYRDFDLECGFALGQGAILEARLRNHFAEGITLLVSGDTNVATTFLRVEEDAFTPIGESSSAITTIGPSTLRVEARGSTLRAFVNGEIVASATEPMFPRGELVIQTLTGMAEVKSLRVTPVASEPPDTEFVSDRAFAAAAPALAALLLAVLFAFLLRGSLGYGPAGLILAASALVPWILVLRSGLPGEAVPASLALLAGAASTLLLFLAAMTRVRAVGVLRFYAAFVVAIGAGALVFTHVTRRHWPADLVRLNSFTAVEWSGSRIEPHLLHAWHPLIRRWSPWVGEHKLRNREYTLHKEPGTRRILFLGTSSTFGYGTRDAYGTMIEERLAKAPTPSRRPVEVIIGAWPGGTGIRQFHFLQNVGVDFEPDIICLSLYYNDSPSLTQFDEPAYFDRISAPGYERSILDDLRTRFAITSGEPRFELWNRALIDHGSAPPPWDWGDPPALRFEGVLRRFAEFAKTHGIRLVLVKEPVRGGKNRLWKDEFYAAMDRIGAEYHAPVVDPTPALIAAGGEALFMDEVHPFSAGHKVIADVLEPILRGELDAIDRR